MTNPQLMPVPFYEDTVVLVGKNNEPFVAMRPVVTNMGLDWNGQRVKLIEKFGSTVEEISTVAEDGKSRGMICLPLRKLPAWLYSISPNKVKPELRDKIVRYQEECDDALWNYWTKGSATRAGAPNITQQLAVSRHRLALLKELHKTRDRAIRAAIHEQLDHASRLLGLSTPALDSIGFAEPETPDVLTEFWDALDYLVSQGERINHSAEPGRLTINLPEIGRMLVKHGLSLRIGQELRNALRKSPAPGFVRHRAEHSSITGNTIKCWVFEQPAQE